MGEAGASDVDGVQVSQRVDQSEADFTPRGMLVIDARRFLVPDYDTMTPLHHVEHRADDGGVLAERVDARRQREYWVDGGQPPILARHVMRGRRDRAEWRAPHDELRRAKRHVIRQVRVPTRELRNLHALAPVTFG